MDSFRAREQATPPDLPDSHNFSSPSLLKTPIVWKWWSTLTGPQDGAFGAGVHGQEQLRRSRLVSAMLVLGFASVALLIPSALTHTTLWPPVLILAGCCFLIAFLNHGGYTNLSGVLLILMVDTTVAGFLIMKPQLTAGNISDLDLFILAVLIGGIVLPRGLIPVDGLMQAALIVCLFVLRPHDTTLTQLIRSEGGSAYSTLAGPLILQMVATGIAWLQSWSVQRALIRANKAEELARTRAELSRQVLLAAERNQRLEEGINQILETHRQVAAGNLEARAPTQEDHELWQIAHSLNNLLMRFQQYVRERQRSISSHRDPQSNPGFPGFI